MSPVVPAGVRRQLRRVRSFPSRLIGRSPRLRRWYTRRILKTIDKYRRKNRPLPESLLRLDRQLRRVPKPKRAEMVEEMLELGATQDVPANRALRRAAGRQDRQSGRSGGLRPGIGPGQRQQGRPR